MARVNAILVASDLTEASDEVVRSAGNLAAAGGAELHVLHAFDFPSVGPADARLPASTFQDAMEAAQKRLDEQIQRTVPAGVKVASSRIEIYVAHRAIQDGARAVSADLIVLGAHSGKGRSQPLLGSTADRIIRTVDVPCLIIRAPLKLPLHHIAIPVDLSTSARGALDTSLAWGARLGAEGDASDHLRISVLHVIPNAFDRPGSPFDHTVVEPELRREIEAARERVTASRDLDVQPLVRWGDSAVDEIIRMATEESIDLVVLGTHGHGAVKRALIGSTASGVAQRAPCPVLLVPPALWNAQRADESDRRDEMSTHPPFV